MNIAAYLTYICLMTNFFRLLKADIEALVEGLVRAGSLPEGLDTGRVSVEAPRDAAGHVAHRVAVRAGRVR